MAAIAAEGFPPIAAPDARILVLGSLPGERSIAAQQYYAHPRNAFWAIMSELYGVHGADDARCDQLKVHRIAVWDVLASSVRPGSLDARIDVDSARVNDFAAFLAAHRQIERIAFNGRKAEQLFHRFVELPGRSIDLVGLPSTSPAYAAMSFSGKLEKWREAFGLT